MIGKAFNDSKAIGLECNIIDEGIIEHLLGKAERQMLSLKTTAKIEAEAHEKVHEKKKENKEEAKEEKAL